MDQFSLRNALLSTSWLSVAIGIFFSPSHRLGDDGGQAICRALLKNKALTHVHLGSNDLGEPTAAILSQVLKNISGIVILGALRSTRDESEIAVLLLRLGLLSTLFRHENWAFRKRWRHDNHVIPLPEFSSNTNDRWLLSFQISPA